jgi:hypothetical protein
MSKPQSKDNEKFDRSKELADVKAVMMTEPGRRVVSRLLGWSRLYQTSFAGQSNQTIFNEGMRNVGLMLLREVDEACPDLLLRMMAEGKDNG